MKHYPIQYLRAIAAMLVVFEHFKIFPFSDTLMAGTIGVDIFYIISGFIMSINIDKYRNSKSDFILNRVIRTYPLYIILTIPLAIIYLHDRSIDEITIFSSVYFIGDITGGPYKDPVLYSGWTLFYEFVFYGLIVMFAGRQMITVAILCVMGLAGTIFTITSPTGYLLNQFYFLFAIGMLLERLFRLERLKAHSNDLLGVSSILLLGVMLFNDHAHIADSAYVPRQIIYVFNHAVPRVVMWGLPSAFFIVSFYIYFKDRPTIPWLNELGNMSYSIYLVHTFLFQLRNYLAGCYSGLNNIAFTAFMFLLIFPLSKLTYEMIEIRLGRWLKNRMVLAQSIAG